MSRWADYGFPQIYGVPVFKLLEGLYLANAERYKIMGWYDTYDPDSTLDSFDHMYTTKGYEDLFFTGKPIYQVVHVIEMMFTDVSNQYNRTAFRVTPDFERLSPETLAKALGQDLVEPPLTELPTGWDIPAIWHVTYEWIRQRYEMLNIATAAEDPMWDNPVWRASTWHAFDADSEAKAYEEFYASKPQPSSGSYGIGVRYESTFNDNGEEKYFTLDRYVGFVEQFQYHIAGPSDLKIYSTPRQSRIFGNMFPLEDVEKMETSAEYIYVSDHPNGFNGLGYFRSRYNDMGLGLELNKRQLFSEIALSSDIKMGDMISLSSVCDRVFEAGLKAVPQSGPKNGKQGQWYQDTININPTFIYDFKKYLEFC